MKRFILTPLMVSFSAVFLFAQGGIHAGMVAGGSSTSSLRWTIGEVLSGPLTSRDGTILTLGLIQPDIQIRTDVKEAPQSLSVTAFPVPARDWLVLQFQHSRAHIVRLYTIQGQYIREYQVGNEQVRLSLTGLAEGAYVLQIREAHAPIFRTIRLLKK